MAAWAVAAVAAPCPAGCMCATDDLMRMTCGAQDVKARDDGFLEISCQGTELNCSALPQLPPMRRAALQRLEVTQCALAPAAPLACALARCGASGASELALQQAASGLSEENVRGLDDVESLFLSFVPGALTAVPVEALGALRRLRQARLLAGSALALRPHMFRPAAALAFLEISMSGIRELPEDAFAGLGNLTVLSLWGNSIVNISVHAFRGLDSLEDLRLNVNPFASLPAGLLAPAPRLRRLCLERNDLLRLDEGVLSGLPLLQELKVQSDVQLTLGPRALAGLPALTALVLRSSRVPALPADLLRGTSALVNLTLSYNRITAIPEDVFRELRALQRLDLSGNRIEAVSQRMFTDLAALTDLNLDSNRIRTLPERVFGGLTRLRRVSLCGNQLASMSAGALTGAAALRTLLLARNRLAWSDADAAYDSPMASLTDLQTLDLSHNNISAVFVDWRFVLRQLTRLDLSHNAFQYLSLADVQFLGFPDENITTEVDFRHNDIRSVQPRASYTAPAPNLRLLLDDNPFDCSCDLYDFLQEAQRGGRYVVTPAAACRRPRALAGRSLLALAARDVTCAVPAAAPCACLVRPALLRTECDCARLAALPALPHPRDVGLRHMALRLRSVSPDAAPALPDFVSALDLSGLALRKVPPIPKTVRLLDLTRNRIETVPRELLGGELRLRLARNPLVCDCWTAEEVARLQLHARQVEDYANVTCGDGGGAERRLGGVDAPALCGVYAASLAGALVAAGGALLLAAAALLYRYRLEAQVFVYERGWCLRWLPREEPDAAKRFDAFVSFATEDERFVSTELLPRLETRLTLHVQDRDWEVGAAIPHEIRRSVGEARRTLVVVSRAFLRWPWGAETLRAAHAAAAADRRRRAVVLLLDVAAADLDADTRDLLALATLVRYGDRMCWGKLVFALPKKDLYEHAEGGGGGGESPAPPGGDVWKGEGLHVVIDDQGKLINAGYIKDEI